MFRRSGGWCFRLDAGVEVSSGRRRQISRQGFATKREAVAALNVALINVNATHPVTGVVAGVTLGEYLAEWLEGQAHYLRASTLHSYRIAVGRITALLGNTKLGSLTAAQVQQFQMGLLATGGRDGRPLATKTVANTHVVLHKALADAVRLGIIGVVRVVGHDRYASQ